jgi:YlmC/YmxH family sporulation protein
MVMRWSEFVEKECVNMDNGEKLGSFHRADMVIDLATGKIDAILLPVGASIFRRKTMEVEVKWSMIKKVGPELVIIHQKSMLSEK